MAKQDNYKRTQVRVPENLYREAKEHAKESNMSFNEYLGTAIVDKLHDKWFRSETVENRTDLIDSINKRIDKFSVSDLELVLNICARMGH